MRVLVLDVTQFLREYCAIDGSVATSTVCDIRHIRHHFRCARVSASGNNESATANDSGRSGKPRQPV